MSLVWVFLVLSITFISRLFNFISKEVGRGLVTSLGLFIVNLRLRSMEKNKKNRPTSTWNDKASASLAVVLFLFSTIPVGVVKSHN